MKYKEFIVKKDELGNIYSQIPLKRCGDCLHWQRPEAMEEDCGTVGHCTNRYGECRGLKTDVNWFCADAEG